MAQAQDDATELDLNLEPDDDGDDSGDAGGAPSAEQVAAEAEARSHGWKPESEYTKGDGKWVDAATFNERGRLFNKNLQRTVKELQSKVEKTTSQLQALSKFHQDAMKQKEREFDSAIKDLRVQRSAAIRDGEDETVVALEDRIEVLKDEQKALKTEPVATAAPADPQVNPVLEAWVADGNEWFRDKPTLRAAAVAIGDDLRANGETAQGRAFLDIVAAEMRREFPDKFPQGNPMRRRAGSVEAGGGGNSMGSGRTERDLPAADRALMRQFVEQKLMTKEQFLKDYSWSN